MGAHYLRTLFEPRSVVLIGASTYPAKVGGRVLENLVSAGFQGEFHIVHPRHETMGGVKCVKTVSELPRGVELAVIATPAPTVPGLIEECGAAGIKAAVVITAGFDEAGEEGKALGAQLRASARRAGIRFLGPNCLGLMRPPLGLNATFARGNVAAGSLALVSQSGAVCTALLDWAKPRNIGFSTVVSLGGSSDLDFGEVIDYLAADEKTDHILLYVEGVRDGRRLISSLRAAARMKPVVVLKAGRHPAGSRAAVSHTGAIVGNDDVFDAVVRRTGVVRVHTAGELVAAAAAVASHLRPAGDSLAIVTNGGGPGVMAADRAADLGLRLATLAPETIHKMQETLPAHWSHDNPVDLIGDADAARYRAAVTACLADPGVDGIVAILTPQAMTDAEEAARAVIEAAKGQRKPVIACWMGDASVAKAREILRKAGVPVYRLPEPAVEAFAYVAQFYRNQKALLEAPPPLAHSEPPDLEAARRLVNGALEVGRTVLGATESKRFLEAFRIPIVAAVDCTSANEAVVASDRVGYPVVMKILSPDITHKSDVGGVQVGLPDAASVRAAYASMVARVAELRPDARISGVSIERTAGGTHGRELMVGIATEPVFGPAITFGAGGIAVEVLRDRVVGLPPLNAALVEDMIQGTRIAKMLERFRNLPPVDFKALEAVLLRVSEIACEMPEVVELDINPLLADENGVRALDARVVLRRPPPNLPRYGHLAIHPYPVELEGEIELPDGTRIRMRPIRPEDAEMETAFIEGLSADSKRMRFQSALRALTPTMLARFTQIDYDHEMALVATLPENGGEKEIGVCRYFRLPDGKTCEFAIVVADEWHGKGLGRRMMMRLIEVARSRGLDEMYGNILSSNYGMIEMCTRLGFRPMPSDGDTMTRNLLLDLRASGTPRQGIAATP